MLPRVRRIAAAFVAMPALGGDAWAHGLGQRYDLPLPLGYFLTAAGAAVAVSFVILALFWRREDTHPRQLDRTILHGILPPAIVLVCRILSAGALALIVAAGWFGHQSPFKNIAPVSVWVIWWVGVTFLSTFLGNVWVLLNPWVAAFDIAEALTRRCGGPSLSLHLPYPKWLSVWPACALFLAFAWLELIAEGRDVPRNIATAVAIYSVLTWAGFVLFGRDVWLARGEPFSIAFDLFSRFAPIRVVKGERWEWRLRPFATGLLTREPLEPSLTAFTLLMLATVTVDGFMETPLWAAMVAQLLPNGDAAGESSANYKLLASALLVAGPIVLAALYLGVVAVMARIAGSTVVTVAGHFVLSLVPIVIAYHLAHYFSLFMIAGQFIIPLVSDPFGYGWDLFGTTLYRIDIGIVDARFIWYLSVTAIVIGHIIAVWLGHVTAFAVFPDARRARRSQYPMLVLMVGYTMLSLWILAQPIVEPGRTVS